MMLYISIQAHFEYVKFLSYKHYGNKFYLK